MVWTLMHHRHTGGFTSPGDGVKPAAHRWTNKCIFSRGLTWISPAVLRPDTSRTGLDLWTLTSCSSDTGLSLDEVPSCLTYPLTWRRRTVLCLRRHLRDSRGVQGSEVKPGCAGLNQAGDLLRSSCVCVRHAVFGSCDAMKRKATEHFAHVRIIVKSWKQHL